MKRMLLALALVIGGGLFANANVNQTFPTDPNLYQRLTADAAREVKAATALVRHNMVLTLSNRDPLKVCHAIGTLSATMVRLASFGTNGPSTNNRKAAVNEIMILMAEINTYCRVAVNLVGYEPRENIRMPKEIEARLKRIDAVVERIENGMIR